MRRFLDVVTSLVWIAGLAFACWVWVPAWWGLAMGGRFRQATGAWESICYFLLAHDTALGRLFALLFVIAVTEVVIVVLWAGFLKLFVPDYVPFAQLPKSSQSPERPRA